MIKKTFFKIFIFTFMSFMIVSPLAALANAGPDLWGGYQDEFEEETGLGNRDPREIAADLIGVLLGFLGIISVLIVLFGGFKWMTAGGNDDNVAQAKKILSAGIIGLIIIMMAYGIATFVTNAFLDATS